MKFTDVLFVISVYFLSLNGDSYGYLEADPLDYYWRDYRGVVPPDALEAGVDIKGSPIYLGQVLHDNKLIPGEIYANDSKIYFEFGEVFHKSEAIKILCTPHPEKFQWIPVKADDVIDLSHVHHVFEAGYEAKFRSFVGRAEGHGEKGVGKVMCWDDGCYKLTTMYNGKWEDHEEYELLIYVPGGNVVQVDKDKTKGSGEES